ISRLVEHVGAVSDVPVLGNGDIFSAEDAVRMREETGCAGVVIGRGCLGRPWLFSELAARLDGRDAPTPPTLGEVSRIMYRHGELLAEHHGEDKGMRDIRKHVSWYLRGFPAGSGKRVALSGVRTLADLAELLADLPADEPFPADGHGPRGRQGSASKVLLPEGWLDDPEDDAAALEGAEVHNSGGGRHAPSWRRVHRTLNVRVLTRADMRVSWWSCVLSTLKNWRIWPPRWPGCAHSPQMTWSWRPTPCSRSTWWRRRRFSSPAPRCRGSRPRTRSGASRSSHSRPRSPGTCARWSRPSSSCRT